MRKGKLIAGSLLSIVMCSSLIAGATYALFTSESKTNIAVTSGNVDVRATAKIIGGSSLDAVTGTVVDNDGVITVDGVSVENVSKYTFTGTDAQYSGYYQKNDKYDVDSGTVKFTNEGTAYLDESDTNYANKLVLNNITPGDAVKLQFTVTNNSNVKVNYRIKFYCDDEVNLSDSTDTSLTLFDSLKISVPVGKDTNDDVVTYYKPSQMGVWSYATAWNELKVPTTEEGKTVFTSTATIELPITVGNEAKNRQCNIYYVVEAVQGNANLGDNQMEEVYIDTNKSGTGKAQSVAKTEAGEVSDTEVVLQNAISNNVETANATSTEKTAVTVTIPKAALQTTTTSGDDNQTETKNANSVQVNVTSTTIDDVNDDLKDKNLGTVSVTSGSTIYAFDIDASVDGDTAPTLTGNSTYEISFDIGDITPDMIYHKDKLLTTNANDNGGEYYKYEDGTITLYVKSFSPFVVSYLFGGGLGSETLPYLIFNGTQLQSISTISDSLNINDKYFKLIDNISLDEMLTINKSITLDLNGHTLTTSQTTSTWIGAVTITSSAKNEAGEVVRGKIVATVAATEAKIPLFDINTNSTVVITNVDFDTVGRVFRVNNYATLNVTNSEIKVNTTDTYAIFTFTKTTLNLNNVKLTAKQGIYAYGVSASDDKVNVNITNSQIVVGYSAVVVGTYGNAVLDHTTINRSVDKNSAIQVGENARCEIKNKSNIVSESIQTVILTLKNSQLIIDDSKVSGRSIISLYQAGASATIRNNSELKATAMVLNLYAGTSASVENSKLITSGTKTNVIQIYEKSTLQLTKSTIEAKDGSSSGIYFAKENGGASVANATITESTIIASSYAISSNASPGEDGQAITRYIKLDVSKSTLKSIGAAGVLLNVPITKVDDVKFDDCNIYGASQAVVIRGGKATITNCRLGILYDVEALNSSYPEGCKDSDDKYYNWSQDTADKNVVLYSSESYDTRKTWGDGNNVYRAVLVLGDDGTSTAYAYDTEVVIDGVTFTTKVQLNADTEGESKYTTAIYALGKEANKVTLTINGENNFGDLSIIAANGYVTVVKNSSATVTYYVATAEELFAASSKADGDIVILMNDIDLNDSLTLSDDE